MLKGLVARLNAYEKLMRLDKPIGILLLLWPTLWGVWLASPLRTPNWALLWLFVLGTLLMRSAGCIVNDIADRKYDGHVARTQSRPLVTGAVSLREAGVLLLVLLLGALAIALKLNTLALYLAIPAVILAGTYPLMKRFFAFPQVYLGIAFGFGIPMAYAATLDSVPAVAWCLMLSNLFWTLAYDTIYALVDKPDDLKIGIKTAAISFGAYVVPAIMGCYALFLIGMLAIGLWQKLGLFYYGGVLLATILAAMQYPLIKHQEPRTCFRAFLDSQWMGAAILLGIALDHYFLTGL